MMKQLLKMLHTRQLGPIAVLSVSIDVVLTISNDSINVEILSPGYEMMI